jgi:PTH1 family peptidyl-tRNA hydrolase
MLMVVGLGNPGDKYDKTRHNIGFMFLDYLAREVGVEFKESRWEAMVAKANLESGPSLLVKPQTFMNLSGRAVARIAAYHKIEPGQILVVHDDLDLEPGRLKIVQDRGPGGHNGIRSVIEHLGTRQFIRFRIGIGRPPEFMSSADFVLSRFNDAERKLIDQGFAEMAKAVTMIDRQGASAAMNFFNRRE